MIKRARLFINDNEESIRISKTIEKELLENNFIIDNKNYDLGIAIGGDGAFLRMVKEASFNSNIYYIGIQETIINSDNKSSRFYSLNEIVIRDKKLKVLKSDIKIDNDLLEKFMGDGIIIATSHGSTAHNLSYGGSIVYNTFTSLQITPMGPINSKVYRTLFNSVIIPSNLEISIIPIDGYRSLIVTIDGENNVYNNVDSIITKIENKSIKCLRLSHYNFPEKINEKLLSSE